MASIKTPRLYVSEPNAIEQLGSFARTLGGNQALVVAGRTAWDKAGAVVGRQLESNGISFATEFYSGFPSVADGESLAARALDTGAGFIVGVGGGRTLDVSKLAAARAGLPHIAVPTIAATCAAFAACVVLYNKEGAAVGFELPETSPIAVFADTSIIAAAPTRYLKAGLADTLAKWYENLPNLRFSDSLYIRQQLNEAHLALEIISEHAPGVLARLDKASPEQATAIGTSREFIELVDCVILLAGLVGAITANVLYAGLAHPFYTGATYVPETRTYLHGERVAFGLFAQVVALENSKEHVDELVNLLHLLEQPLTFEQIGIRDNAKDAAAVIAANTLGAFHSFKIKGKTPTVEQLTQIYLDTDALGHRYLERKKG
jgi:glycerol dehydrogenase